MRRVTTVSTNRRDRTARIARMEPLEGRQLLSAEMISINLAGSGAGNGDSTEASVSGDGRYVAFVSTSTDLVTGDTNGKADIFLRDRLNNTTTLISKNSTTGALGDAESFEPKVNNDGTYVVFASRASNLVTGDVADSTDVFRYNISNGAIELVSIKPNGGFPSGGSSEPSISADGRYVAFTSFGGNLGAFDDNSANDVFLRDMTMPGIGAVTLVSVKLGGNDQRATGDKQSFDPQVSDDGKFVSFRSDATNLVSNDANGLRDTFVRDIDGGVTDLVSVNAAGTSGNMESQSNSISGDGTVVAFRSLATDLAPNDTNNAEDIFLRNLTSNTTTLLSINQNGTASARGQSQFPWLSSDGGAAVFSSSATDLINGDANNTEDVFLRDLRNGPIYLISTNKDGNAAGGGRSFDPYVSRDGKFITFTSEASDLSTTSDANGKQDILLQVAPNNPGDPGDPDVDPTPGPGPTDPGTNPGGNPGGNPNPDPNPETPDTTPPVVTLPSSQPGATAGSTTYDFNVNLTDERALNTIAIGNLTLTKSGGSPMTAAFSNVVGSGKSAQATFRVTFPTPLSAADNGTYTVGLPADTIKDAAGNAAAASTLGTITLTVGSATDPDLTVAITPKFKSTTIIAGPKAKGSAKLLVTNTGQTAITKVPVAVSVFMSDNPSRDAADVLLVTSTKPLSLKTGKSKSISLKFTYPAATGTGSYYLIGQADTTNAVVEKDESNNVAVSTTTQSIAAPVVDLFATVARPVGTLASGGNANSIVTVNNAGNVPLRTILTIRLAASTDAAPDPTDTEIITVNKKVVVSPGKPKNVPIKFTFPSLTAGDYFITAQLDPLGAVTETSKSNNTAVTSSAVSIS
jgi:hypothetical protein